MLKSELINKIAGANPHLFQRDVERIVNIVFDEIVDALARGQRVELRGFGAFTVKHRAARSGRNPRTGTTVSVSEKFVPFFKTGKELRERLNQKAPAAPAKAAKTATRSADKSADKAAERPAERPAAVQPLDGAASATPRNKGGRV